MLDRTPTDSGSRESELQLDEVMVFVAKLYKIFMWFVGFVV